MFKHYFEPFKISRTIFGILRNNSGVLSYFTDDPEYILNASITLKRDTLRFGTTTKMIETLSDQ